MIRSEATCKARSTTEDKASQTSLRQLPPQTSQKLAPAARRLPSQGIVAGTPRPGGAGGWSVCSRPPQGTQQNRLALGCRRRRLAAVALGDPAQVSEGPDLKEHHRSDAPAELCTFSPCPLLSGRRRSSCHSSSSCRYRKCQLEILPVLYTTQLRCSRQAPVQLPDVAVNIRRLTDVIETSPNTAACAHLQLTSSADFPGGLRLQQLRRPLGGPAAACT